MKKALMITLLLTVLCTGCGAQHKDLDEDQLNETTTEEKVQAKPYVDWNDDEIVAQVLEERSPDALQYEPEGAYNIVGLSSGEFHVCNFAGADDFYEVVTDGHLAICIHPSGDTGISFWSVYYEDGQFVGMSSEHVLFESSDGTVQAVSLDKKEVEIGEYSRDVTDFSNLSDSEKKTARYSID